MSQNAAELTVQDLRNMRRSFSRQELLNLIDRMFTDEHTALDMDVVDAAIFRLLLAEGQSQRRTICKNAFPRLDSIIYAEVSACYNEKNPPVTEYFLSQGDFLLTGIPRGNGPMESDCARSNAADAPWHPRFSGSCAVLSGSAATLCRADRAAPPYCTLSGKQHPASAGKHMLSAALHPSKSPLDWKNEGADEPPLRGV